MIGRADIEESKYNVATNAWLQQASYPFGNFLNTKCNNYVHLDQKAFSFLKIKQTIALLLHIMISSHHEFIFGSNRYCLSYVPPQPNFLCV